MPEIEPEAVLVPPEAPASATERLSVPVAVLVPADVPPMEDVGTVSAPVTVLVPVAVPASATPAATLTLSTRRSLPPAEPPQEKFTAHASLVNV